MVKNAKIEKTGNNPNLLLDATKCGVKGKKK